MRAFFAVPLEDSLRQAVAKAQEDLRAAGADVSWVRPESLHLTLKFLGDVGETARFDFQAAPPFDVDLAGVGEFSKRVVWAGCRGNTGPLTGLAARAESAAERAGVPREERAFSPHVTIGRIRSGRALGALRARMAPWKDHVFGVWPIRRVVLFRSDTSPRGSVYKVVTEFPCPGS